MDKLIEIYEDGGCPMFILALLLLLGIYCLESLIFYLLWSWLAISYFNAPVLNYWACMGIVYALHFLRGIIFGRSSNRKN